MKKETLREKLIDAIFKHSEDELYDMNDWIRIAKESEEELADRLINILNWYADEYNSK